VASLSPLWALVHAGLAAFLCAQRARSRGYLPSLYASLGLLLGLGSLPVCFYLTQVDGRGAGQGLTPEPHPEPTASLQRQTWLVLSVGLIGAAINFVLQFLVYLLPLTFQQTSQDYERGIPPAFSVPQLTLVWMAISALFPILFTLWLERRRPRTPPAWLIPLLCGLAFYALWAAVLLSHRWIIHCLEHLQ